MASIRRIKAGWQAQVARKGVRTSKTFPTKREAQDWAARQEHLIATGSGKYGPGTLADVLRRYARTESPKKKGERWEVIRLTKLAGDSLGKTPLRKIDTAALADWRDRRLRDVGAGTVRREMTLLNHVFNVAMREWGLMPSNPLKGVARPKEPPRRDRLVTDDEIERLVAVAGTDLRRVSTRAVHAFRFSCITAMRAGEVCALRSGDVEGRVARLHDSKTGKGRDVPLSLSALDLWALLPGSFDLTPRQLDANFRLVRDKAKITGITYHDSRHRAITDMARKITPLDLARAVGHDDLNMLMRYYEASADDIAGLLD